jgi:hypothetical protein
MYFLSIEGNHLAYQNGGINRIPPIDTVTQ